MGRGSSGIGTGKGKGQPGKKENGAAAGKAASGWRKDYEDALRAEQEYMKKAEAMDAEVKAAQKAYYDAPQRSKAQKAEAEKLKQTMDELTRQQMMLKYRAAQLATFADNLLAKNSPAEHRRKYNKRKKEEIARRNKR